MEKSWKRLELQREKCDMEKANMGGCIFKCALQVNDFYMKVWNFISCHPIPKTQILDFLASAGPGRKMSDAGQVLPS